MNDFIRKIDFLIPILVGLLFASQTYQLGKYDQLFIIFFVATSFASTRYRYVHANEEYKKRCEEIIKARRESAKKEHWYDGYGVVWGSITTGSILISVIVSTLLYFLYMKFMNKEYIIAFLITGLTSFLLRVLRYLAKYFFWDVASGVIVVAVFVFFSKLL